MTTTEAPVKTYDIPVSERIVALPHSAISWGFGGNPAINVNSRAIGKYGPAWQRLDVDPFPCYAHDTKIVEATAVRVEKAFPIGVPPTYWPLPFEDMIRTNGQAGRLYVGNGTDNPLVEPYIILSGKRIPLHPAMTRYLVAHEYGHCVQWWIEKQRGIDSNPSITDFDREYCKLRKIPIDGCDAYGGLNWHRNIGELIANDFRICICGVEEEFWPHEGFAHPRYLPHVREFWDEMRLACAFKKEAVERFDPSPVSVEFGDEFPDDIIEQVDAAERAKP